MVVRHYRDIIGSGKCINGNGARNKCNAIDSEFMALYPSSETDEYLPLVKALGDAAWGGFVQLFESSPRYDDTPLPSRQTESSDTLQTSRGTRSALSACSPWPFTYACARVYAPKPCLTVPRRTVPPTSSTISYSAANTAICIHTP